MIMNKEILTNTIIFFLGGVVVVLLWPVIKWLAIAAIVLVAASIIYVTISAKKIKKEIEINPNAYYSTVNNTNNDVIDVEYKEKEVQEEKVH